MLFIGQRGKQQKRSKHMTTPTYREAQGDAIERLQKYAGEEIEEEKATTMNCAVFTEILDVCGFIGETHLIKEHRVYPGLRKIGEDRCHHEYRRNNNRDVFTETAKLLRTGRKSLNASKRAAARVSVPIFNDVHTKKFRVHSDTLGRSVDKATDCSIQTSHLNLYYTLTGLKYICENAPDYIEVRDEPLFDVPLQKLTQTNVMLNERKEMLQAWMGI